MIKRTLFAASAAALLAAFPAHATLQLGATVPSLMAQGALNGRTINFNLQQELRKGPVVLYFFPKANTPGCNLEAKAFAERMDDFKRAGAQVIGMSGDTLEDLTTFSMKECAGKFPVARATPATIQAFDVTLDFNGQRNDAMTNRTTYVIAKDGKVVMAYSAMKPEEHISNSLAAVEALKKG
jgi:peroxiredoxin